MSNNREILGLNQITKEHLKELCKKHRLYQTPHLNDQLYLHFQGFQSIQNLEEYTGLKCLWLESNAISEIQGLQCQKDLKCLFLQNNLIRKIENLEFCSGLDTLNLASNHITKIENCGVDVLPVLSTLNLSRNYIRNSDGLKELLNCKSLWSLDLSHNRIDDILVVKIFAKMPELRVLVLQGNPVVSQVPQYRKTLILECKNLTYLDSRPVFPKDRACAEAWKRGGYEEERKEHDRWIRKDRRTIRESVNATLRLRKNHGDSKVQFLPSSDDEDEEKSKKAKSNDAGSSDLEITGVELVSKARHEDPAEDKSQDLDTNSSTSSSSDSREPRGYESNGQEGPIEMLKLENNLADRDNLEQTVDEVAEHDLEKLEESSQDEGIKKNEAPPVIMQTSVAFSDPKIANNKSCSPSSSSEEASESESSDEEISEDGNDDEDPRITEETAEESPKMVDIEIECGRKKESILKDSENAKDETGADSKPENADPICFDGEPVSQRNMYQEAANEIGREPADDEDSGLFNSYRTASSTDDVSTLILETPSNLKQHPPENSSSGDSTDDTPSESSLVSKDTSINPEDIEVPTNFDVKSWIGNFLNDLQAEQERGPYESSSSSNSQSIEDFSEDTDTDMEQDTFDSVAAEPTSDTYQEEADGRGSDQRLWAVFEGLEECFNDEDSKNLETNFIDEIDKLNAFDSVLAERLSETCKEEVDGRGSDKRLWAVFEGLEDCFNDEVSAAAIQPDSNNFERTLIDESAKPSTMDPNETIQTMSGGSDIKLWAVFDGLEVCFNDEVSEAPNTPVSGNSEATLADDDGDEETPTADVDAANEADDLLKIFQYGSTHSDADGNFKETINVIEKSTVEQIEAEFMLERILFESQQKMDEATITTLHEFPTATNEVSVDDEDYDCGDDEEELPSPTIPTPTLHEGLDSFNKVVGIINKRRQERLNKINDLVNDPRTKEHTAHTQDHTDKQIEQIKHQQKHERVRQLVEHVYAQKERYDDTLEVIDGRLMVVKRDTGDLEEVQPPPQPPSASVPTLNGFEAANDSLAWPKAQESFGYVSRGVSTNFGGGVQQGVGATPLVLPLPSKHSRTAEGSKNDSGSDDYGTPLSGSEHEDGEVEFEHHQSDTKIRKMTFPSMSDDDELDSRTRTSSTGLGGVSFGLQLRREREEALQKPVVFDGDILAQVCKLMNEESVYPTTVEISRSSSTEEDALEDVGRLFGLPADE